MTEPRPAAGDLRVRVAVTPPTRFGTPTPTSCLSPRACRQAAEFARLLPGYEPTPLLHAPDLATDCGISEAWIKHEGHRAPTGSFKVLGPPYALARQLQTRLGLSEQEFPELVQGKLRSRASYHTACAATSGNHGRALAWAAQQYGCGCRIYMSAGTGAFREAQIRKFGAETIRVPGTYDDAVDRAVLASDQDNLILVGDGARANSGVLADIIRGYSVVGHELSSAVEADSAPTHIFIPAGSGSLSAGVTGRLRQTEGEYCPRIVIVQSHAADAGYQSCVHATRSASKGDLKTIMDGLSVRELSPEAWPILDSGVFAFLTISDRSALEMLHKLAAQNKLTMGDTGIAAVAGLRAATQESSVRRELQLDQNSRVIMVATEAITDPPVLKQLLSTPLD